VEVVASLSQGRTAAAQCGLFTHKSVPVIFEPPCTSLFCFLVKNVILVKKLLHKQIFSTHIYFPIDLVAYKPVRNNNYRIRRFTFVYYFFQYNYSI